MILWECKYTLHTTCMGNERWASYWHSTTPMRRETVERSWRLVNQAYTVSDFTCAPFTGDLAHAQDHILPSR